MGPYHLTVSRIGLRSALLMRIVHTEVQVIMSMKLSLLERNHRYLQVVLFQKLTDLKEVFTRHQVLVIIKMRRRQVGIRKVITSFSQIHET